MKIDKLKRDGNVVSFEVEDDYSELEVYIDKKYKELVKKYRVPGFRQGKTPKKMFYQYYGFDKLSYEAMIDLLNNKYPSVIADHDIAVIDYPKDIKVIQMEKDKPLIVSIEVEVKPEVKVNKYKGIKLEKEAVKLGKEDVSAEVNRFLEGFATYDEDNSATTKVEDIVTVDVEAMVDGEKNEVLSKEGDIMKIGAAVISKEVDDQLIGMNVGDTKAFDITFPEDEMKNKDLAGKKVDFKIKLSNVKVKQIPELTDELISEKSDKMSVEDYTKSVEEKLRAQKELAADNKLKEDISRWVSDNVVGDIPDIMVSKELDYMVRRMEMGLQQYNLKLDAYLSMTQKTAEDLRADYKEEAIRNVKLSLGLEFIASTEAIEATSDDMAEEVEESIKFEKDEEKKKQLREQMLQMEDNFKETIVSRKTIDFLIKSAKIKQKK